MTAINGTLPRNYFYLGQEHSFTAEAGILYPIYQVMLFPGDLIEVENECLIRQMPTIAPSFSKFKAKFWDVVIAIRNLDPDIYRFLSGFEEYSSEEPWDQPLPRWTQNLENDGINKYRPGTLWDYLENPTSVVLDEDSTQLDYYRQAYAYAYDILFRNETRQKSILVKGKPGTWKGEELLRVNWDKDYLTTSLPKQQIGDPLAITISGIGSAQWNADDFKVNRQNSTAFDNTINHANISNGWVSPKDSTNHGIFVTGGAIIDTSDESNKNETLARFTEILNKNTIDFKNAGAIMISTIREAIAQQCINETDAITGIKDDEFLEGHWGEKPTNEALQYPEVFGKEVVDIFTSEVIQTSAQTNQNGTPLGDMAGHGLGTGRSKKKTFYAKEFSIYLKLMYIKCDTIYGGQQAKREYTQKSKFDFPFPELNHISMQPIYGRELLCASQEIIYSEDKGKTLKTKKDDTYRVNALKYNQEIKGYDTNFAWYKEKLPRISGLLKQEQYRETPNRDAEIKYNNNLYHWTEARFFKDKDGERPSVNNDFLQFKLDNRNYAIIDDTINRSQFIVRHNNKVDSWRTMSKRGLPSNLGIF